MKRLIAGLVLLAACTQLTGCFGIIDQGNAGVRTSFGKVENEPVTGMYTAFLSSVDEYTVKETSVSIAKMTPRAADNLTLRELDVVIYYTTNPAQLPHFQASYSGQSSRLDGDSFYRPGYVMIDTLGRSVSMDAVSRMDSLTIHANRPKLEQEIKAETQRQLDAASAGTFTITRVVVTNVQTDPTIERSIQENVTAGKRLDTARKLVQIREQEGLANQKIAQSLTPEFLQHEYNQAIATCAANDKCTLVVDGSGTSKILNVGK